MGWFSSWIQGIIVTVIIATIIEMILPEGNSKKYIKVVIGVYILFSIISPVINKITGENLDLTNILDINQYIEVSTTNTYENINQSQDEQIRNIYETSLKNDMEEKIRSKGYQVKEIVLQIKDNEEYTLESIEVVLEKQTEQNTSTVSKIETINEINIHVENEIQNLEESNVQENKNNEEQNNISDKEKKELKEYLSSVYEIEEKNININ